MDDLISKLIIKHIRHCSLFKVQVLIQFIANLKFYLLQNLSVQQYHFKNIILNCFVMI